MTDRTATRTELHPLSIVRSFWKHKLFLLIFWLAAAAVGMVVVQLLPTRYRSEALILVDSQKIPEKYVSSTVNAGLQDRLASIRQQILSTSRLKKIIDDFDLYRAERKTHVEEEIIERMRKDIEMQVERGWTSDRPGAFRVAYIGKSPATVAEVANRIANLFIEENLRTREVQAEGTSEFIQNQLNDAKKKLDELEIAVSRYKVQHNGELPEQESALLGALQRLQLELQGNQDAVNRAQQNKVMLENALSMAEATEAGIVSAQLAARKAAEGEAGAAYAGANGMMTARQPRKRSEIVQEQLELLRVRYSDDHPDVRRLRDDLERVKAAESKETADAPKEAEPGKVETAGAQAPGGAPRSPAPQAAPRLTPAASLDLMHARERISTGRAQLKLNAQELEQRAAERKQILSNMATYQRRLDTLPVREQEMAGILRDYEISKANYKSLLEKRQSAEMATEMERRQKSERFTILDQARIPELPYSPQRILLRLLSGVVGLFLALVATAAKELPKGPLLGEWELPAGTPILARVPKIDFSGEGASGKAATGEPAPRLKRWRLALVSSAALAVVVVGVYLAWGKL